MGSFPERYNDQIFARWSPHVGNLNSGIREILLVQSGTLGSGIRNPLCGIQNLIPPWITFYGAKLDYYVTFGLRY